MSDLRSFNVDAVNGDSIRCRKGFDVVLRCRCPRWARMHKVTPNCAPEAFTAWLIARVHYEKRSDILREKLARCGQTGQAGPHHDYVKVLVFHFTNALQAERHCLGK